MWSVVCHESPFRQGVPVGSSQEYGRRTSTQWRKCPLKPDFGALNAELWRAIRLVVDTGLHTKQWTRDEAIDYFLQNSPLSVGDATVEVERYIARPGQALSYKIGMLKIQELRAKAEAELGESFDIREFHDAVLRNGAVPLPILERVVNQYIARVKASN